MAAETEPASVAANAKARTTLGRAASGWTVLQDMRCLLLLLGRRRHDLADALDPLRKLLTLRVGAQVEIVECALKGMDIPNVATEATGHDGPPAGAQARQR